MNQNLSWIKLYRKLLDWEWYKNVNTTRVFIHLLLRANVEDRVWKGVAVNRGQFITSIENLAKETHLSFQQTRTALHNINSTSDITIKTTNKYTLITINKYNDYQQITSNQKKSNTYLTSKLTTTKDSKDIRNKEYNTLESLGESDLKEIAETYKVSLSFVQKIYEELRLYCGSTGKKYANYKMTLMAWVRRKLEDKPTRLKDLEPNQILDIRNNPERLIFYQRRGYDISRMRAR